MSLSKLPDHIRHLIVRLPYRVGYYISQSDQSGGDASSDAEMKALENVVTFYVEDFCKSEFAQAVMLETLQNKHDWANWQGEIQTVPEDLKKVFDGLIGLVEMKDIIAFKNNLLEIAVAVAMAYREFDATEPWVDRFKVYLSILIQRIKNQFGGEPPASYDQLLNISREEKMAINLLADTLGIKYKVG